MLCMYVHIFDTKKEILRDYVEFKRKFNAFLFFEISCKEGRKFFRRLKRSDI